MLYTCFDKIINVELNQGTFSKLLSCTDTLEKCKSAFGPTVQGKMVEPTSLQINNLIYEEAKAVFSGKEL